MTRDSTKWFTWGFSGRYGAGAGRGAAEPGTHHTHHGAGAGRGGAAEPGTHPRTTRGPGHAFPHRARTGRRDTMGIEHSEEEQMEGEPFRRTWA